MLMTPADFLRAQLMSKFLFNPVRLSYLLFQPFRHLFALCNLSQLLSPGLFYVAA